MARPCDRLLIGGQESQIITLGRLVDFSEVPFLRKIVIVGGARFYKIAMAGAILFLICFGLFVASGFTSPVDAMIDKVNKLRASDPEQALALYPSLFALIKKDGAEDWKECNVIWEYGRFLRDHGSRREALAALTRALAMSIGKGPGTAESNLLVDVAYTRLELSNRKGITEADLNELLKASRVHPSFESKKDPGFWAYYDDTVGRTYLSLGQFDQAIKSFEKASTETNKDEDYYHQECQSDIIDALIKEKKYKEANDKFIEFVSQFPDSSGGYLLRKNFRRSLKMAQLKDADFGRKVRKMLAEKQFEQLDKLAFDIKASEQILSSGKWLINEFYEAIDSLEATDFDKYWQERVGLLEQWTRDRPQSATAKCALGAVLTTYAWKARGSGWADSVSDSGWKLFGERLDRCKNVMDQVKDKPCEWYSIMQRCALGQGWETAKYNAMVSECQKRYPGYDPVLLVKSYWLQPRWHGQEGEYESFVAAEANKRKGSEGDMLYARSALYLEDICIDNVLNNTKLSWPRVKSGAQAIIKKYPDSLLAKGVLSVFAMEVDDKATAQNAFNSQ